MGAPHPREAARWSFDERERREDQPRNLPTPPLLPPPLGTEAERGPALGVARCRGSPPREYGGWESTGEPGGDGGVPGTVRGDTKGPGGAS